MNHWPPDMLAFIVAAVAVLSVFAVAICETLFTRVSRPVRARLRLLASVSGLALGAGLMLSADRGDLRETSCQVIDRHVREHDEGNDLLLMARLRWRVAARTLTDPEPFPVAVSESATAIARAALLERYPPGREIACCYPADRPAYLYPEPPGEVIRGRRYIARFVMFVAALHVMAAARSWRRRIRTRAGAAVDQVLGVVTVLLAAVAASVSIAATLPAGLLISAAGALVFLRWRRLDVMRDALCHLRARLADPEYWPTPQTSRGRSKRSKDSDHRAPDPFQVGRVAGLVDGVRVRAAVSRTGAQLEVDLEAWPELLEARPKRGTARSPAAETGDPVLDRGVHLDGPDHAWRPFLTAAIRDCLRRLVGEKGGTIDRRGKLRLDVSLRGGQTFARTLDAAVAFARSLPPVVHRHKRHRVLELARAEPVASVRMGHYRWLVRRRWNAAEILRIAANDPDPDIAAWAADHMPPSVGAYR